MKKRRDAPAEERRQDRVEMNLIAEEERPASPLAAARRGCTLPFLGGILIVAALAGFHGALG